MLKKMVKRATSTDRPATPKEEVPADKAKKAPKSAVKPPVISVSSGTGPQQESSPKPAEKPVVTPGMAKIKLRLLLV